MNREAINKRIAALESELAGLKADLNKPERFAFSFERGKSYVIHSFQIGHNSIAMDKDMLGNFRYRQTETNAEADFQLQKELMCIGALAEQIYPDYKTKVDWGNSIQEKFYIIYNYKNKKHEIIRNYQIRILGVVYMSKDVAEKVCEILNNKGVEL